LAHLLLALAKLPYLEDGVEVIAFVFLTGQCKFTIMFFVIFRKVEHEIPFDVNLSTRQCHQGNTKNGPPNNCSSIVLELTISKERKRKFCALVR